MDISDRLWNRIVRHVGEADVGARGRPQIDRRRMLSGIVYVLISDIGWRTLPFKVYRVSGNTCWRQFREWVFDGTWPLIEQEIIYEMLDHGFHHQTLLLRRLAEKRANQMKHRRRRKGVGEELHQI